MKNEQWIEERLISMKKIKQSFKVLLDEELKKLPKTDMSLVDMYRSEILCANTEIDLLDRILED